MLTLSSMDAPPKIIATNLAAATRYLFFLPEAESTSSLLLGFFIYKIANYSQPHRLARLREESYPFRKRGYDGFD